MTTTRVAPPAFPALLTVPRPGCICASCAASPRAYAVEVVDAARGVAGIVLANGEAVFTATRLRTDEEIERDARGEMVRVKRRQVPDAEPSEAAIANPVSHLYVAACPHRQRLALFTTRGRKWFDLGELRTDASGAAIVPALTLSTPVPRVAAP